MKEIKEKKSGRKGKKIALWCVVGVLVVLAGIAYWQRNNLQALWYYTHTNQDQRQELLGQQEQDLLDLFHLKEVPITALTQEELQGLQDGTLTIDQIVANRQAAQNQESGGGPVSTGEAQTGGTSSEAQKSNQNSQSSSDLDARMSTQVAKLYAIKASFVSQLEGLVNSAKSEFLALPADQRTSAAKDRIAASKISAAGSLEANCDSQVNTVAAEMRQILKEKGGDTSVVNKVLSAYEKEKSIKKAYYMGQLS